LFVFNFHHEKSYSGYRIPCYSENEHFYLIDTDESYFGGHNRVVPNPQKAPVMPEKAEFNGRPCSVYLYLPSRCAMVLIPKLSQAKKLAKLGPAGDTIMKRGSSFVSIGSNIKSGCNSGVRLSIANRQYTPGIEECEENKFSSIKRKSMEMDRWPTKKQIQEIKPDEDHKVRISIFNSEFEPGA